MVIEFSPDEFGLAYDFPSIGDWTRWMVGGPRRPNFNPFLTGHHGILQGGSQIIFHIKYSMLEKMRKKGSMDDKCDD